nr:MAG TPA: hypothetical protein [Caudoviricetes sp.]
MKVFSLTVYFNTLWMRNVLNFNILPFDTFEYYSVTLSPTTRGGPAHTNSKN